VREAPYKKLKSEGNDSREEGLKKKMGKGRASHNTIDRRQDVSQMEGVGIQAQKEGGGESRELNDTGLLRTLQWEVKLESPQRAKDSKEPNAIYARWRNQQKEVGHEKRGEKGKMNQVRSLKKRRFGGL